MTKPVKIKDDRAIDAAKDFAQAVKQMHKDFALLQMKQARETTDFMAQWKKTFRGYFRIATEGILDDPDEAYSKNTHALDLSYLDFGDVYLVTKAPENPKLEQDEEDTGEFAPPRLVIN